jgi:cytochrome c-type biogenesis protein CcmF
MADLGYIALLLALVVSIYSALASFLGARRGQTELWASARNAAYATFALVSLAAAVLVYAIISHDFQIEYIASYTSRDMSLTYLLSAFWAGNEGSLLFWAWILGLLSAIVLLQNRRSHRELMPYVSLVVMITEAFFLLVMVFVSNPFAKLAFIPPDGRGLNPLLENPGMLFHPPTQLVGYAGLAIPFAFAIAALITGRLGDEWLRSIRRWTLIPWLFLGIGNLVGSWWAYVELGWGGYWAWDPVENAGLLPWLTATAFLHSAMIQKRRGMLKVWNMVLIIVTFHLAIFGTFITRSGLISSVHTFGVSALGPLFLGFIAVGLVASTWLLSSRLGRLRSDDELDSWVSRESTFLLNNLILVGATFAIFLGTVFPMISEAVRGVKITVGAPFFNQVNAPIFFLLILLMGICPLIGWRRASTSNLVRNFLYPLTAALALGIILFILGIRKPYVIFGLFISVFVLSTIAMEWFRGVRARHRTRRENYLRAFFSLVWGNRPRYGGYIVHVGIIIMAIGILGSTAYKSETEAGLTPGESITIENYTLKFEGISQYPTQKKMVTAATLSVYNDGRPAGTMTAEKYFHANYEQSVTEVAIRSNLVEDLYVILAGTDETGVTAFKVLVNPLVSWIWLGSIILVLGGLIALWPEGAPRSRKVERRGQDE